MKIHSLSAVLVMVLSLNACSYFAGDSEPPPPAPPALEEPAQEASPPPEAAAAESTATPKKNYIEILWSIPEEKVDGYLIRYGYSRDKLEFERKLGVNQVETIEDASHGFVYRHLLEDIAPNKKLFVSLISIRGDLQSEPSQILEVEAN